MFWRDGLYLNEAKLPPIGAVRLANAIMLLPYSFTSVKKKELFCMAIGV
jgi:hypothetical protein